MKFDDLGLVEPILRAVRAEGYQTATPIQAQAIPKLIKGHDLIGCAQTGTGKTAAFALPTLQKLRASADEPQSASTEPKNTNNGHKRANGRRNARDNRKIRALVLSPTRELAVQIGESFSVYGRHTGLRHTIVYGGVSQVHQVRALQKGVDTVVATPGRLLDLIGQGHINLKAVETLILDEADRMLDMGFIHDLRRIVTLVPPGRQTLMFSATMSSTIRQLAAQWLNKPIHVQISPDAASAETVEQSVYHVEPRQKLNLLTHFLQTTPSTRTLVFSRTKHGADKIVRGLLREGIRAAAIHGNKSQAARQRVLGQFKSDQLPVLIATDVAARGLDVDDISHVINYDMPNDPETYIHRIGRTGRAGADGIALSFCGRDERGHLRSIERLIRRTLAVQRQPNQPDQPRDTRPSSSQSLVVPKKGPHAPKGKHAAKGKPVAKSKSRPPRQRKSKSKSKGSFQKGNRRTSAAL